MEPEPRSPGPTPPAGLDADGEQPSRSRQALVAGGFVLALAAGLAGCPETHRVVPSARFPVATLRIASGPVIGWAAAIAMGKLSQAATFLLAVTALPAIPIGIWLRSRSEVALAAAVLAWLAAGWFLGIGIWV